MKKNYFTLGLVAVLLICSCIAFAGDGKEMKSNLSFTSPLSLKSSDKMHAVKINILSPIVRTASLFYEHGINDNSSVQLGLFYTGFKVSDTKFSGFGITPEFRYHPSGDGLAGFYVAPFLRYQSFTLTATNEMSPVYDADGFWTGEYTTTEDKATLSTIGGGVLAGYQWIFGDIITLDLFLGPMYNSGSLKVDSGTEDTFSVGAFDGFTVRTGVTLGVAF
jgi:hypothetical protein